MKQLPMKRELTMKRKLTSVKFEIQVQDIKKTLTFVNDIVSSLIQEVNIETQIINCFNHVFVGTSKCHNID